MDIEIVNIILVGINIIFIFVSSIYLAKLNTKLDIQKNKKNKLQELEIEYIIDYWKNRIELSNKIYDFILLLDVNANSKSQEDKDTAWNGIVEIFDFNKSLISQFNSIKFFLPDKAIELINEINENSFKIIANLQIVSTGFENFENHKESFKYANRVFEGIFSKLNYELFTILKEYFYEDNSLITKIKKWFIKLFKKKSP